MCEKSLLLLLLTVNQHRTELTEKKLPSLGMTEREYNIVNVYHLRDSFMQFFFSVCAIHAYFEKRETHKSYLKRLTVRIK